MGRPEEAPLVDVPDSGAWRAWLESHHDTATAAWLVMQKKGSQVPGPSYIEAVEEALCFGWIDSKTNRIDATRYKLYFARRKRGSVWAASNKVRVERLIAEGRMTSSGLVAVESAQKDGSWDTLNGVDDLLEPEDLRCALDAEPDARSGFDALPVSARKIALYWIASAKRPKARAARITRTVADAARGRAPR
jgi:uncharacterized protein YdeI (YjbR/CyaY-like superfamily)